MLTTYPSDLLTAKGRIGLTCIHVAVVAIALMGNSSCTSTKNTTYFQDIQKDTTLKNLISPNLEPKIQKNDFLNITVASLSPDIAFYNASQNALPGISATGSSGSQSSSSAGGYLVDQTGNISFVKLGVMHVEGMTQKELKAKLENDLVPYLKDAVVSISFLNRHVTLLGAITPHVLSITSDNMTILDALASSGDISERGRVDNILVIREVENGKEFKRLNLTNRTVFYSPYYYLQPNDIVYIEPVKVKTPITTAQIITYITTGVTLIFLIINNFFK